jgi:hypothetical protein
MMFPTICPLQTGEIKDDDEWVTEEHYVIVDLPGGQPPSWLNKRKSLRGLVSDV